ncbi:MAG: hypothetical protein MUO36_02485 [Candidatus Hadarchaeum sp.]|nr:hypothetical protein [Candidatus Hadarchaeum sp.]
MPFYILFGVIVAAMLAGIFIMQYNRQLEARVDEQAQALANDLARISFTAFSREQPSFLLPRNLGGSDYELSVDNNTSTFIVHIKAGKQSGMSYYSTANVSLKVENSNFAPSGNVYFQRRGDNVVVSSSPIVAQGENLLPPVTATPPEFYGFAKENAKVATAIAAAYWYALDNLGYPSTSDNAPLDAVGYNEVVGEPDNILVQLGYKSGDDWENLFGVRVIGNQIAEDAPEWKIASAWVVTGLDSENFPELTFCPSIENAWRDGWFYSPEEALAYLRSRTWMSGDNIVVVPADALVQAAAATTNVSTYPTYRVTFEDYVLYYQAMPWWAQENSPGFVFQSKPPLEAVA